MLSIFKIHQHDYKQADLLYSIDKDIEYSAIFDWGFTRTYRVKAIKVYECNCGKVKRRTVVDKTYYQHNPLDKEKFVDTVIELERKGYTESNLI